jgi:hypothetical protein
MKLLSGTLLSESFEMGVVGVGSSPKRVAVSLNCRTLDRNFMQVLDLDGKILQTISTSPGLEARVWVIAFIGDQILLGVQGRDLHIHNVLTGYG